MDMARTKVYWMNLEIQGVAETCLIVRYSAEFQTYK